MRTGASRRVAAGLALLGGLAAGCRTAAFDERGRGELAEAAISRWDEAARLTAEKALEQYGPPDAIAPGALGWRRRGPWRRMVVWDAEVGSQHAVAFRVPASRRGAVAAFGRGVKVSEDGRELIARSDDERHDILALNLAAEVARGARDPEEAGRYYDRALELEVAGKSSLYLTRLLFSPDED